MTLLEILVAAGASLPAPRIPIICNLFNHSAPKLGMRDAALK